MYTREERAERAKQTVKHMIHTDRMHRKECEKRFSSLNIHRSQHMLLMTVARIGEGVSQKRLAEELNISPAAIAKSIKTLELDGMITRSSCADDARQNEILITEKGKSLVEESRRIMKELDTEMVSLLSDDELDTLCKLFTKMQSALSQNANISLQ